MGGNATASASQRVLQNAGFQQEGRLRNFLNTPTVTSDALVFSAISDSPG